MKKKLQNLLSGVALADVITNSDTNFRDIRNRNVISEDILWNLLWVSGYLKPENLRLESGRAKCDLKIPNREILVMYEDVILEWFRETETTPDDLKTLLQHLTEGNMEEFTAGFTELVRKTFSYFDVGVNAAENFYHAFILGLLVNLDGKYQIKSNRESGKGRPDVLIIPVDPSKKGVIIEFKTTDNGDDTWLQKTARETLALIEAKEYADELKYGGIKEAVELAIVFCGKKLQMAYCFRQFEG